MCRGCSSSTAEKRLGIDRSRGADSGALSAGSASAGASSLGAVAAAATSGGETFSGDSSATGAVDTSADCSVSTGTSAGCGSAAGASAPAVMASSPSTDSSAGGGLIRSRTAMAVLRTMLDCGLRAAMPSSARCASTSRLLRPRILASACTRSLCGNSCAEPVLFSSSGDCVSATYSPQAPGRG